MLRVISRNIASNWAGFAVQVVVVFFLTPFILSSLGPSRYGVWALVTGLTGYYGLMDLGFRAGMTQYLTRYLATKNFVRMNAVASTGFLAMVSCGALVATVTVVLAWLAPSVFRIPSSVAVETQLCILIIGVSTAVSFACHPFAAVFPATQRFEVVNGVVIGTCLLSAGATFTALKLGHGLVTLSIISAFSNLTLYGTLWRLAYSVLPELIVSPRLASRESFWPIIGYGIWSFFINGANILKARTDIILIGIFMPIEAIAPYALALSMAEYLDRVFTPIGYVFFPAVTHLDARGDSSRLKSVYLMGSKILMLLVILTGGLSAVWAGDFFRLWVGDGVTSNGLYPSPATLYHILVGAVVCTASQRIGQQVCMGTRKMKSLAGIVACEAVLKIGLSVLFVQRFGLIGVAVGTLLPTVVFQVIVLPANVLRILGINVSDYVRNTCVRPVLMLVALVCLLMPIMHILFGVSGWLQLFLFAGLTFIVACIPLLLIGLNRTERRRFVLEPILHLGRRVAWNDWSQRNHSGNPCTCMNSTSNKEDGGTSR